MYFQTNFCLYSFFLIIHFEWYPDRLSFEDDSHIATLYNVTNYEINPNDTVGETRQHLQFGERKLTEATIFSLLLGIET